jgi:hypothetical protein
MHFERGQNVREANTWLLTLSKSGECLDVLCFILERHDVSDMAVRIGLNILLTSLRSVEAFANISALRLRDLYMTLLTRMTSVQARSQQICSEQRQIMQCIAAVLSVAISCASTLTLEPFCEEMKQSIIETFSQSPGLIQIT